MRAWNSSLSVFNLAAMSLRVLRGVFILSYREFHKLWILYAGVKKKYIVYLEYSKKIGGAALTWGACVPSSRLSSIETVLRA